MPPIVLQSNERVLITGKTGSGKTYLAHYITRELKRLVVLDGKGTLKDWNLEEWSKDAERRMLQGEPVRLRAIVPLGDDPVVFWDKVITSCYYAGNVTLYIDELYAVSPPNKKPLDSLWAVYTRGRELGVGVWSSTQRPVWIPLFALSEAEHFFMFRLQLMEDRQRIAAFMSSEVLRTITDKHGFFYMRADMDEPIYTEQLDIKEDKGSLRVKKSAKVELERKHSYRSKSMFIHPN